MTKPVMPGSTAVTGLPVNCGSALDLVTRHPKGSGDGIGLPCDPSEGVALMISSAWLSSLVTALATEAWYYLPLHE